MMRHFSERGGAGFRGEKIEAFINLKRIGVNDLGVELPGHIGSLVTSIAPVVAAYEQIRRGREPVDPEKSGSHAENFLRMLFGAEPDPLFVRALDLAEVGALTFELFIAGRKPETLKVARTLAA